MTIFRPIAVALILAVCTVGCSQTLRVEQADLAEQLDSEAFLHEHLPTQPMVTVAEAYRAMLILADGDDNHKDFAERASTLTDRGIVRPGWDLQREACIDRGSVAYMVCKILNIKGGVNARLLGSLGIGDRRYAVRELAYLDIMTSTPAYRYMSGAELIDLLAKADAYMAEHKIYEQQPTDIVELLQTE